MMRLGINVDHIATLRNARGECYPSPIKAAALAELGGADNITCHLREDRRHIRDKDVALLREIIQVPLNLEIAATDEMIAIALEVRPHSVTLVPEKRQELTTEGGLHLSNQSVRSSLAKAVASLREAGITVSLFIAPRPEDAKMSADLGAHAVELHTGEFCSRLAQCNKTSEQRALLRPLINTAMNANGHHLQVHVGHGLNYQNAHWMTQIPHCEEANIGHAVVCHGVFVGLTQAVAQMKALLNEPKAQRP